MALIDIGARSIHGKIVYYGPGFGGKTTNLKHIHRTSPARTPGGLVSIASATERTLFFDSMPLDLGEVHGFDVRFHLYTVPGQPHYERTRKAVLNGADGVVFVADARRDRLQDNLHSLQELAQNVSQQGNRLPDYPFVLQYNKMDLPDALAGPDLDRSLNTMRAPRFEATAVTGSGVFETLRTICKLVAARF